jgi:hypothetical protein
MSTKDAKAKREKYSQLAKRNTLYHHQGNTWYAGKRKKWQQEEREVAEVGRRIHWKVLMRGDMTSSMPVS